MLPLSAFIEIARKGFAAVPDFSSTIHVPTERSLKAVLPDLGGLPEPATFSVSMRGYIALSRALDADGVLIARPFAPTLFQQGPQPFATLLLAELQGNKTRLFKLETLPERWAAAQELVTTASKKKLVDTMWECGLCGRQRQPRNS